MNYSADIQKLPRHFLPTGFTLTNWEVLEPFFKNLDERKINSLPELEQWLKDYSMDELWRNGRLGARA